VPQFGKSSLEQLATCDPRLQVLFELVVQKVDCKVICGHRSNEQQALELAQGSSTLGPGMSKHNRTPSLAVDVVPYFAVAPHIRWDDVKTFSRFVGYVEGVASVLGIRLRVGLDWDGDWEWRDQKLHDLPHFELVT